MQFPITIGLHRSFLLRLMPLAGFFVVLLIAFGAPLPGHLAGAMPVAALFGLLWLRRQKPLTHRVDTLRLSADGSLSLAFADAPGYFLPAVVQPGATVHRWLTVIRVSAAGKIYSLVLTPDAIAPEDFRRLRVFLRWRAKFTAPDAAV